MVQKLPILLSADPEADEAIGLPCEDEMMDILLKSKSNEETNLPDEDVEEDSSLILKPIRAVAFLCAVMGGRENLYDCFLLKKR